MAVFSLSGSSALPQGVYTLKRFSSIIVNGQPFTVIKDINFDKPRNGVAERVYPDNSFIYQGSITEHPTYACRGEEFEVITVVESSPLDNTTDFIADNTFSVFVYDRAKNIWSEWSETSSLFLESSTSKKYEKRLNENGNYELKFGNNVNGAKLVEGDSVQIYYVTSNGVNGIVGSNLMLGNRFTLYNSPIFASISNNIYDLDLNFIAPSQLQEITINNPNTSTPISEGESVEDMRKRAPGIFAMQNRLVTKEDYAYFIDQNFNSIVKSAKVLDNTTYTSRYLKYFYTIGLNKPNDDTRVLFNQVAFSNSTSFNNVYVFSVPRNATIINETLPNYLNFSQKQALINACNSKKDITHNVVCVDPIYKAFDIGLHQPGEDNCIDFRDSTVLVVKKSANSFISDFKIKDRVYKIINDYFNNIELGQVVNLSELSSIIKNLDGVSDIITRRVDTNFEVPKIGVVVWNPIYEEEDVVYTTQNYTLQDFEYAYFYEITNLKQKIIVEDE
jgi:DNA-dependent RNA polymerase auxiliary subunit epsilon